MKRYKANTLLTTFALSLTLLVLGIFGTDSAYVILTRFKLQKITEAIALEYASSLAYAPNGTQQPNSCDEIKEQYINAYSNELSGILGLTTDQMAFKNINDDKTLVRVSTTSRVVPAFLRFIGVQGIEVHSIAYAKTERITFRPQTTTGGMTEFIIPNSPSNSNSVVNAITSKARGMGDFTIKFEYINDTLPAEFQNVSKNGGFIALVGYESNDNWADVGYGAMGENVKNVLPNGLICINATDDKNQLFTLDKNMQQLGFEPNGYTKKFDRIRIYKSTGVSEDLNKNTLNPCEPFSCSEEDSNCNILLQREANVTLTAINNVKLITRNEYNSAGPVRETGFCN